MYLRPILELWPTLEKPPADTPISLDEAKAHARIDHDADDVLVSAYLAAAVAYLDGRSGVLGRCLVDQIWQAKFTCWPHDGVLRLPFPDVSAASLSYFDASDVEQTVDASLFEALEDDRGAFLRMRRGFKRPDLATDHRGQICVTFTAGYGDPSDVPATIKAALLLIVGHLYENREQLVVGQRISAVEIPLGVDTLIAPFRRMPI